MIQLARHFADDHRRARLEAAQRHQWFIKAREEQKRRDNMAEEAADELMAAGIAAVMATGTQLADFRTKLDLRETATIEALNENRIKVGGRPTTTLGHRSAHPGHVGSGLCDGGRAARVSDRGSLAGL